MASRSVGRFIHVVDSEVSYCVFSRWWRDDTAFASVQPPSCRSANSASRLIRTAFGFWRRATTLPLAADATSLRMCSRIHDPHCVQPSHSVVCRLLWVTQWWPSRCSCVRDVQTGGRFWTSYVEQSEGESSQLRFLPYYLFPFASEDPVLMPVAVPRRIAPRRGGVPRYCLALVQVSRPGLHCSASVDAA